MAKQKKPNDPTPSPVSDEQKNVLDAHKEADEDISEDPEMDLDEEAGDDLDEGELARLDNSND
jgi:hypothetical protein